MPTIPTSRTSSGARPSRSARPASCATPVSTWTSTARTPSACSTRTPTTRFGSPTSSWTPSWPGATGPSPAGATGRPIRWVPARDLFRQFAQAAWECADPGMQFDSTINRWHTASNTGRINGSNPCSEYMHLDNSACNLASFNLMKFLHEDSSFDIEGFRASVEVVFTAQEIIVGNADYPTEKIAENSRRFRELGIGYANLGCPADGPGPALRLRPGPGLGGRHHRPDDRARLCHLGPHRGPDGTVRRLPRERRAHAQRAAHAPRRSGRHRRGGGAHRAAVGGPGGLGVGRGAG